ncbi:MAG: DUF2484 family protein [Paracoccaceae bacterium]
MTATIYFAIAWVFASTIVAFLPMRRQYVPGVMLLAAAPVLIVLLWIQVGWLVGVGALLAFLSMFRNPLRYFYRKWRGLPTEVPE